MASLGTGQARSAPRAPALWRRARTHPERLDAPRRRLGRRCAGGAAVPRRRDRAARESDLRHRTEPRSNQRRACLGHRASIRVRRGAQAHDLEWSVPLAEAPINLALRPDGELLAILDRTGTVTLLDTARCKVLRQFKPSSGEAESFWLAMAFSPTGQDLALSSPLGLISLWSVSDPTRRAFACSCPATADWSPTWSSIPTEAAWRAPGLATPWSRCGTSSSSSASCGDCGWRSDSRDAP